MTIPEALDTIDEQVKAWQAEEILALSRKDAQQARECRLRVGVLEQLAHDLREKAMAA